MAAAANESIRGGKSFTLKKKGGDEVTLDIIKRIGVGGQGDVWEANMSNLGKVVIKRMIKSMKENERRQSNYMFRSELAAIRNSGLSTVSNTNNISGCDPLINCFYGIIEKSSEHPTSPLVYTNPVISSNNYYLIYEYIPGMNLKEFIDSKVASGVDFDYFTIVYKLLNAINHMHSLGIVHRDLKPLNIMINETRFMPPMPHLNPLNNHGNTKAEDLYFGHFRSRDNNEPGITEYIVKLIDFGLSVPVKDAPPIAGGTLEYMPPESFLNKKTMLTKKLYDAITTHKSFDMYAIGCILYYIFSGKDLITVKNIGTFVNNPPINPDVVLPDKFKQYEEFIKKLIHTDNTIIDDYKFVDSLNIPDKKIIVDGTEKIVSDHSVLSSAPREIITRTESIVNKYIVAKPPVDATEKAKFIRSKKCSRERYTAEEALRKWCEMHGMSEESCIIPLPASSARNLVARATYNAKHAPLLSDAAGGAGASAAAASAVGTKGGRRKTIRRHKTNRRKRFSRATVRRRR